MNIPFFDLKTQYAELREEIQDALVRVCENASFILGQEVEAFEREFAAFCEVKHCVAVNSGTSALHLALLALGIGPEDEVITTPNTFTATAEAICYTGAKPVFVDIDPRTANIDPHCVRLAVTKRTKAILPVHLYGRPADMSPILNIAHEHQLAVLEDACQAHGSRYRGKRVGGIGKVAAFSFYPSKNLGGYGEGGALTTNDSDIAERVRTLRDHGQTRRYVHNVIGYNYRMDGFQGAVLRVKLKWLDTWNRRRQQIAAIYRDALMESQVQIPQDDPRDECVYHLFPVYVDLPERVSHRLAGRGVATALHYPYPLHIQEAFSGLGYKMGSFPYAERACRRVLSMPLFPELTNEQVSYAAEALEEVTNYSREVAFV